MEAFSYRSLLYLTMDLSFAAGLLGVLTTVGWFLTPLLRRRAAAAGAGDLEVVGRPMVGLRAGSWLLLALVALCFAVNLGAQFARYAEVRHWPAQTMYEVIPLGTTACFLSVVVLYFVLGLHRLQGVSRGFGDKFVAIILLGCGATIRYVLTLDPSGRPLPPALQSYWFPTHISAYVFGYFTLFIATLATWLFFAFRFWRGVLRPAEHSVPRKLLLSIGLFALVPVPFGWMGALMGPGILALTGAIALFSVRFLPQGLRWFDAWEAGADTFTWKIFMVGFPFLTAGLVQGALWAQEAWATYWGWDSKEVSALISWLFYAVYLHLRYVAGWRGERCMWILLFGGLSVYITFQLFGDLPASQSSLHRYTDSEVVPAEGLMRVSE